MLQGLVIGFSIAAPVGPIGALCIRRTLVHGPAAGLATGLGAACADAVYGSAAAFGLTAVASVLVAGQTWLRLVGGLFLLYLGLRTLLSHPRPTKARQAAAGLLGAYASTFVLTITNPITILSFAAIFAGLGLARTPQASAGLELVGGVFAGSALWWLVLSTTVGALRQRLGLPALTWITRISGIVIAGFGVAALVSVL